MAENSKIEWCDHTVNLWWGCSKVHTGCRNCYAEHLSDVRFKKNLWGKNADRLMIKSAFSDLDKYQKQAEQSGEKLKIFVGSMMDIYEKNNNFSNSPYDIKSVRFLLMEKNFYQKFNNLIFLFLTKRPENIFSHTPDYILTKDNVWFGTSVSNQRTADKLIPELTDSGANNMFLSVEPQIQDIDIRKYLATGRIKWVIQGGESGPNRRYFDIDWAYHLKEQCKEFNIPYFFKQIDKIRPVPDDFMIREFPKF